MKSLMLTLLLSYCLSIPALADDLTAVVCRRLLDGVTWSVQQNKVLVVRGDTIVQVTDRAPSGATRLDLTGYTTRARSF